MCPEKSDCWFTTNIIYQLVIYLYFSLGITLALKEYLMFALSCHLR